MRASEWWKWFWRFAVLLEASGGVVGFVAMEIVTQTPTVQLSDPLAAVAHASVAVFFAVAAMVTAGLSLWAGCVTVPVWIVSEICFARMARAEEEHREAEAAGRAFASPGYDFSRGRD